MMTTTKRIRIIQAAILFAGCLFVTNAFANWKSKVAFWSANLEAAGWSNVFASNAQREIARLPAGVQTMLKTDVKDNPWVTGHEEMQRKLGKFRPEAMQVFDLPYIPIPANKMKFKYMDSSMSANMKRNVKYTEGGREMIRFFFHPLYANKYKELIQHYGVKHGEYWATPTSSPRSLVVWKKNSPTNPIWVKVSLHAQIDHYTRSDGSKVGISRVQTEKKAHRSALVNSAFRTAQASNLRSHMIEWMPEPASFVPGNIPNRAAGFDTATIFRELPSSLTSGSKKFVPAFAFIKDLKNISQRSGVAPMDLVKKGLIEPLVRSYLYLGLDQGLQGEMHTQNFLLEVNRQGVPTGKLMVKDLDGFRMDLDMRIRNGKSISFLNNYKNPFEWAKHSATQGSSSNPAVLQAWFNKLIRNVNGFTTTRNGRTVYATPAGQLMERLQADFPAVFRQLKNDAIRADSSLRGNAAKASRKAVEMVFDAVAREQFQKITGIEIPADKWGFGQNKGLNYGLNQLRAQLFADQRSLDSSQAQSVLRSTWNHLRKPEQRRADERTFVRGQAHTYRLIGKNIIEGISRRGKSVGYAFLKPADVSSLNTKLTRAGLRAPTRTRTQSALARYAGGSASRSNYSRRAPRRR